MKLFLEAHGKQDPPQPFTPEGLQLALAHCVDIFETLNNLNPLLHGKNADHINDYDAFRAFMVKLELWHLRVQKGNTTSFPSLDAAFEKNPIKLEGELKTGVEAPLRLLKRDFERYFPDMSDTELPEWKITRDSFYLNEGTFPD